MFSFLPVAAFQGADSAETWMGYEHALLSCLRTRDDPGARRCLEKLSDRFGESNAQVMGLKGLYEEAVAEDEAALDRILRGYESTLNNDPTNTVGLTSVTRGGVKADASSTADRETTNRSSQVPLATGRCDRGARQPPRWLSRGRRRLVGAFGSVSASRPLPARDLLPGGGAADHPERVERRSSDDGPSSGMDTDPGHCRCSRGWERWCTSSPRSRARMTTDGAD